MRLNEIQTRFKETLLDSPAALDNIPDEFASVFETGGILLSERLGVYRNNVMGNVGNALMANFPLLEKIVGKDFLSVMARSYVLANPPMSGCLTFYGADFDRFIRTYEPAKGLPYLADMARLEILMNECRDAEDDIPLSAAGLSVIPEVKLETIRLKPRNSVRFMASSWPLWDIRDLCLSAEDKAVDMHTGGAVLIYRQDFEPRIEKISGAEFCFLKNIGAKALGEAVADSLAAYPDFDFAKTLNHFMTLEIFRKET